MITLKQLEREMRIGTKFVWFSEGTLWWTHEKKDVNEATKSGYAYFQKELIKKVNSQSVSLQEKQSLFKIRENINRKMPCDPIGFPLKKMDFKTWMQNSLASEKLYGKHRINAFLMTHHQNNKSFFTNKWDSVNEYIDRLIDK